MKLLRAILPLFLLATGTTFAAPPTAEQEQAFTALVERVQKNPGIVTPDDVTRLLQLGQQLNRPYAASLAVRVYLAQAANVPPALLRLAAENAELAGDLRSAAARYRQYLRAVPSGPEASAAAARFYRIQIDFLGAGDDAYRFMDEFGDGLRQSTAARQFDQWFLTTARERRHFPALARRLAAVLADQLPLEAERLWHWETLEWLLTEIGYAQPEHFEALPHCRRIAAAIRGSPRLAAKFQFYTAHLGFKAGAAGKESAALDKEFEAVLTAARAYVDAVPTLETGRDIIAVFSGGVGRFNEAEANRQLAQKRELYTYIFGKLSDADREQFISDRWATPAQWIALGTQYPAVFQRAAATPNLSLIIQTNDLTIFQKQTPFLQGVRGTRAAIINSVAAGGGDLWASAQHLIQKESWHLPFTVPTGLLTQNIWPTFASFPRPDTQKLADDYWPKFYLRYGAEHIAKTPLALFHPDAARDYLGMAVRVGDKAQLAAHVRSLEWVPYTDDQRRLVFGPALAEFRPWADRLRRELDEAKRAADVTAKALTAAQTAKDEKKIADLTKAATEVTAKVKAAETAAATVTPIEDAFKQALEPRQPDPAKAPNPLCQNFVKATLAIRAKNLPAYTEAVKALYVLVRDYDVKRTPFGAATLAYCLTHRAEFDAFDLHAEIVADQLTRYTPNSPNIVLTETLNAVMTRPGWNWGAVPAADKARALKLNELIAKVMLPPIAKGQFNPDLFNWLRQTRRGAGWFEPAQNADLFEKMIEQKVLLKSPVRFFAASGTVSYQWLIRNEFPGVAKKYPVETALDDLFVEETRLTKYVDVGFWSYSRDEQRKGANVAAEVLAGFAKYPFGYEDEKAVYSRVVWGEAQLRALNAADAQRNVFIAKLENYFATTRFDLLATGYYSLLYQADVTTPEGRQAWFAGLKAYLDRAASQPTRWSPPHGVSLARLAPQQLAEPELSVVLRVLTECRPQVWVGGVGSEGFAAFAYDNLRRLKREGELFALLPVFWKIAKDTGNGGFQRQVAGWVSALSTDGFNDLAAAHATLGLDLLGGTVPEDVRNGLLALRSKALSSIGSFIPVERADRRYPLYAAQNAYLSGNSENAWQLYAGNRDLVTTMHKELDPAFLIWLVERHTELGAFDEAEALARLLVQWVDGAPQSFEPEIRARLLLSFAGIAYARQEYPRARAQYEQIGLVKEFEGTLARRQAELRVAEVDRLTRNFDQAVERLEKLVQRKDIFLQAEGNYLLALVKFDQEQYPEARTFLEQVFAVEPSHANARILEGKLYLQLKKLIEATDVKVGLSASQRTIVPGRPLKVQLEDRNLAIVGKSSNIEIRAWTDSGDEETFNLLPFGDSKTKFEGQIPTVLGPPKKGDRTLQVRGGDIVRYDFSDRFKQANKISANELVAIAVVSEAELYASSGKIMTREEQEERAMEQAIRARVGVAEAAAASVALSTVRAVDEIKPGARINVRVIDLDQSRGPGTNTVTVRVAATSGDRINAFPLRETGTYTGTFEGQIPTTSAPATAFASDSEEGKEPNHVISRGDYPPWVALPDNQRPKIFTVDLNNNVPLGKLTMVADVPGRRLKNFILQTSLNGKDFSDVATWPQPLAAWDGSLRLELARIGGRPLTTLDQYREYLEVGHIVAGAPKLTLPGALALKWDATLGGHAAKLGVPATAPNNWYIGRLSGSFYLESRQVRTFRVDHKNQLQNVRYALLVNGQPGRDAYEVSQSLAKGVHRVELFFVAQRGANLDFELLTDTPQPPYIAPAPVAMFDVTKFPAGLSGVGFQPAQVVTNGVSGQFDFVFAPETRARVLRWWLVDFETDAPAIRKITLQNAAGEVVLPPAQDIVALRNNQVLELVPGDRVTVTYEDPQPISKERQVQEAFLRATFYNATLSACFVESTVDGSGNRLAQYIPLRRFKPGDPVGVFVQDPDGDVSDQPDRLKFWVQVGSGSRVELEAMETAAHSGVFIGRVFPVAGAPQRPAEITVGKGDDVVIGYLDQENTDPGIPWERRVVVEQTVETTPQLRVFEVTSRPLTEEELTAVARSAPSRRVEEYVPVQRSVTVSWPEAPGITTPAAALHGIPVVVELLYPTIAQTVRSKATVYVQTATGRKQAAGPLAEPFDVTVPGTIKLELTTGATAGIPTPVGYRDVLVRGNPKAAGPLEDGRFTFIVPLKLGPLPAAGQELERADVSFRVPASYGMGELGMAEQRVSVPVLNVRGNDEVFIGFQYVTEAGVTNWLTRSAKLGSDVFFDAMERRYQEALTQLHVGESVYFRVVDPAADVSEEKDVVSLQVLTSSGLTNSVSLMETLPFSGVFKGVVALTYAADRSKPLETGTVAVKYGDAVRVRYQGAAGTAAVERVVQVFKGADGNVLPFTKRFKEPEIAVQTQFTVAEAHFEMAKKHRELAQDDLARRQIAQGKKLLEEAIRDYPNTEARAQADYLLADLALEFANDAVEADVKKKFYLEAVGRYSEIVANYPESTYAPKSQYKKALTFEKMGQIDEACEEYVKLSYRYPDNELVAETIARLGQYFLTKGREMQEKAKNETNAVEREKIVVQTREMYKTAAQVFGRLGVRFPDHKLAAKATVLSAQCYMRGEDYPKAIAVFQQVIEEKKAEPDLMAQSMYWAGDCHMKRTDYVNAYRMFKRLTWDYPESQWAKFARGRLSEDTLAKVQEKDTTGGL